MPAPIRREVRHFEDSEELNTWVSAESKSVALLSFSGGKDSIATWIALNRYFTNVHLVYMYFVPNLPLVEDMLDRFEDRLQTRILRLPHPSLYRMLNALVFQPPEHCQIIEMERFPEYDYDMLFSVAKMVFGIDQDTYTAVGVRARDSMNRWASIKQFGAVNLERHTFYPVYDWDKNRLLSEIRESGIPLPVDYHYFGRTFDGLDYRFLKVLKEKRPDDFRALLEWFPLAELELYRMQYRRDYYDRQ